jgi:hypothetical protein
VSARRVASAHAYFDYVPRLPCRRWPGSSVAGYGVRHLDRYFTLVTVEGINSEYKPADVDVHPWIVDH